MEIKFELASKHLSSNIIVADADLKCLKNYKFDKKETAFIKSEFGGKDGKDLVFINRYNSFYFLAKLADLNTPKGLEKMRLLGSRIFAQLKSLQQNEAHIDGIVSAQGALALAEGLALTAYQFDKYLSKPGKYQFKKITLVGKIHKNEVDLLSNIVEGTFAARTLVNEPVCYLTAEKLSKEIEKLSKKAGFKFEYFTKKKIESLKMGGLLGVNQGSKDTPTFNMLEYKPAKAVNKKPLVFVGKGVVFDTGGISLKPSQSMEQMKGDMAGAAAVVGAIYAIAKSKLPYHVVGLIPSTDNRIGSDAIVVSDIITISNGKTVEVMNTDAEGRLILADALHYAKKYDPELVIDLATLTGAAVAAIGEYGIVGMGKDSDTQWNDLEKAGYDVYERLVKFPLWDEYGDLLKSNIADIKNIGGPKAGAITAGKFLEHFVDYPWIHLDISNALLDSPKGYRTVIGTGSGVRLLTKYVLNKLK
jgi:leucyl aminopeptidase